MKPICLILSSAILLTGCYSYGVVENSAVQNPNLADVELTFELRDGSTILSAAGEEHSRIEGGYRVVGTITKDRNRMDFDGIVQDSQIKQITSCEVEATGTAIVLCIPVLLFLGSVALKAAFHTL